MLDEDMEELRQLYTELAKLEKKGELGEALADYVERISIYDLAMLCTSIMRTDDFIPGPYGKKLGLSMRDKIYDGYQRMLTMKSAGAFKKMTGDVRDKATLKGFCGEMIKVSGPLLESAKIYGDLGKAWTILYCLTSCFSMFVLDKPGHPAGMPFPGGFCVENRGGVYYCPSKGKQKDVTYAFCNFCPSRQADIG